MSPFRIAFAVLALLATAACNNDGGLGEPGSATIRVVNASATTFDVLVDGDLSRPNVGIGAFTSDIPVTPGTHQVRLVTTSGANATLNFTLDDGKTATAYAYNTSSSFNAALLPDTGSIVPATKTKLRVSHLSANAGSIQIWRTQPDFQAPSLIMTPFNYLDTSPYLQSDAGTWDVFVTRPGSTTRIADTGPVDIPAGESRSVVLLDSAGVLRLRVLAP